MNAWVKVTPDDIKPDTKWILDQGLDTIGVVERYDWPEGSKFAGTPYELWTPSYRSGQPVPRFATLEEAVDAADTIARDRARTSTLEPVEAHRETYRDTEFVITRVPATAADTWRRFAHYKVTYGGKGVQCPAGDVDTIAKRMRGYIDQAHTDRELLPRLVALIDARHNGDDLANLPGTPKVGDVAYVWAMGRLRQGLVTKLGRKKVTVSYTTASSQGRIFHKADTPEWLKVRA
jgi:hypothetical protein